MVSARSDSVRPVSLGPAQQRRAVGRRPLLLGAGLAVAAAATGCSWLDRTPETPDPEVHPDHGLLTSARDDEATLLALAEASVAAHPGLAATLTPFTTRTQARLDALDLALGNPTGAATASPPTDSATPATPGRPAGALRVLAARSHDASSIRTGDCVRATDHGVARLLASLAAGNAQDVIVLRTARGAL